MGTWLHTAYYVWHSLLFQKVAELKARLDQSQEQLKQKKSRSDHLEKTVKQQQQELKRRAAQLAELEKVNTAHHLHVLARYQPTARSTLRIRARPALSPPQRLVCSFFRSSWFALRRARGPGGDKNEARGARREGARPRSPRASQSKSTGTKNKQRNLCGGESDQRQNSVAPTWNSGLLTFPIFSVSNWETGASEMHDRAYVLLPHSPRGCASRSLQSLNYCGREKKGTACSLMDPRLCNVQYT